MKFFSEIKEVFQLQFTAVCLSNLLNPIPTGTCRNQPIYEYHGTTAGRNRVKSPCHLAKHRFSLSSKHCVSITCRGGKCPDNANFGYFQYSAYDDMEKETTKKT